MKILVDKNVIEFMPENPQEESSLEVLWKVVIDCYGENKKIVPMGNFVPGHDKVARFYIEGVPGGKTQYSDKKVEEDCTYFCAICNKYKNCKAGEPIPLCCGKEMEPLE